MLDRRNSRNRGHVSPFEATLGNSVCGSGGVNELDIVDLVLELFGSLRSIRTGNWTDRVLSKSGFRRALGVAKGFGVGVLLGVLATIVVTIVT